MYTSGVFSGGRKTLRVLRGMRKQATVRDRKRKERTHPMQLSDTVVSPLKVVDGYFTHLSQETKFNAALAGMNCAIEKCLTPLTSSITGSALRGNDRPDSDIDVLVIVQENIKARDVHNVEVNGIVLDAKFESLTNFSQKLDTSFPYTEFILSPFRITVPQWHPYFISLAHYGWITNRYVHHFAGKVFSRLSKETASPKQKIKAAQLAYSAEKIMERKTATVPRAEFDRIAEQVQARVGTHV